MDPPSAHNKVARSDLNHNGKYIWNGDCLVLRAIIETNRVVSTTRLRCHVNKFHTNYYALVHPDRGRMLIDSKFRGTVPRAKKIRLKR